MSRVLFLKILIVLALILAIPGAFFGYRAHTHSTSYLLARGNEAIERMKTKEVERLEKILENKGEIQAAHLLRGKFYVYAGEAAMKEVLPIPPSEEFQQAGQMVLGAAGLGDQAFEARGVVWLMATLFQRKQGAVSSPALNAFRKALGELAQIQDDGPIGVEGTVLAAECLMRLQEQRLAEEGLKALIKRHPDNRDAHRFLSVIYIDLNSATEAIHHLQEWARLDPSDGLPYRWIGFFKKDNSQEGEAAQAYEEALQRQLTPEVRTEVLKELAELYSAPLGDYSKGLATLDKGSDSFQRDPEVVVLRVNCLRSTQREAEAVELVEKTLRENPNSPRLLWLRALLYVTEDKPGQALPRLEKAVDLDPFDLQSLNTLVSVYDLLNRKDKAEQTKKQQQEVQALMTRLATLVQTANRLPWDDRPRLEIGILQMQMKRYEQARTWLQAALACNPNNSRARRLLNQLPSKEKPPSTTRPASNGPRR